MKELVGSLGVEQRKELLAYLALEQQATKQPSRDLEMWSVAVVEALDKAIGPSIGALVIRKQLSASTAWNPVAQFMEASRLQDLTVVERQGIYTLLAKLLVKHAREVAQRSGAPLSGKLVASCAGNLPGVFDGAFPGYLAAGLAPMVARSLSRQR